MELVWNHGEPFCPHDTSLNGHCVVGIDNDKVTVCIKELRLAGFAGKVVITEDHFGLDSRKLFETTITLFCPTCGRTS